MNLEMDFGLYPHYSSFLLKLQMKANRIRADREIEEEFGKVSDDAAE